MLDIDKLRERISGGQTKLKEVGGQLKSHFVGLDFIIDRLMRDIAAWYIMPEIVTRPTVINLWGMTGVGKTDLVRRLVRHLEFTDRFLEVQLTTKGSSDDYWLSRVEDLIDRSSLEAGKPGILLLDEMQNYRSISDKREEIHDYKFQDVWTLLSDGQFSSDATRKKKIDELIFDLLWEEEEARLQAEAEEEEEEDDEPLEESSDADVIVKNIVGKLKKSNRKKVDPSRRRFQQSWWKSQRLKKLAKRPEPVEDIMGWTNDKNLKILQECQKSTDVFEGENYSQLLIFVSGNLDEAFSMAGETSDADVDADVFHEHSKRITFIDIKRALKERFKPEQIARFGNMHLIYPSLSAESYREIIRRKIMQITENVEHKTGISVSVESSLRQAIYRNGVFPVQGTRPLFSTITSMVENTLPTMLLAAIESNENAILMEYEFATQKIIGTLQDSESCVAVPYVGELDKIRERTTEDSLYFAAVHEAGHAVAYATTLEIAPTQLSINLTSREGGGFIWGHALHGSKEDLLKRILISVAGRAAEGFVFGERHFNQGASSDIGAATKDAALMVRDYGMSNRVVSIQRPHCQEPVAHLCNNQYEDTDKVIEEIVTERLGSARDLLRKHEDLFHATVRELVDSKNVTPEKYQEICSKFGVEVEVLPAERVIVPPYKKQYKETSRA